jgi:hypothetical protein
MSTFAAVILAKERRMVNRLRMMGAVGPAQARTLDELGISRGVILRRLRERAVIRDAGSQRYYLDEPSWAAVRRSRRRAIHVAWVIALIVIIAVLFARRAMT